MPGKAQPSGTGAGRHIARAARRSPKRLRVTVVKHLPVAAEDLRRQFVVLFDLLGLRSELFDSPRPSHTIKVKQ